MELGERRELQLARAYGARPFKNENFAFLLGRYLGNSSRAASARIMMKGRVFLFCRGVQNIILQDGRTIDTRIPLPKMYGLGERR